MEQFTIETGAFSEDPYPIFETLRREAPVFWHDGLQAYILTRYDDCKRLSEDAVAFYNSPDGSPAIPYVMQVAGKHHMRLRKLLNPAFSPRGLADTIEPSLPVIANALIEAIIPRGRAEILAEVAEPMATRVISNILHIAHEDEEWMVKTAYDWLEAEANPANEALQVNYERNVADLRAFFAKRIADERANPSGSLITDLIAAEEGDEGKLTGEELLANTMALVVAGIETTSRLITNMTYLLATHPDQQEEVRQDMTLIKPAIEETLRMLSPNQPIMRYAQKDVEFRGVAMKAGTRIYGMRGAANRDPEVWDNPDTFDVRRFHNKKVPNHLSFGFGPHMCVGAHLSRRETTVVMEMLLLRTRNLRLDPEYSVEFAGFRNRGPRELHVLFDAA